MMDPGVEINSQRRACWFWCAVLIFFCRVTGRLKHYWKLVQPFAFPAVISFTVSRTSSTIVIAFSFNSLNTGFLLLPTTVMFASLLSTFSVQKCLGILLLTEPVVELVHWRDCRYMRSRVQTPGSTLTFSTETSFLFRLLRDGGDPCFEPLIM